VLNKRRVEELDRWSVADESVATFDVDAITEITSYADYLSFPAGFVNSVSPKTRANRSLSTS
jgi:hypothetical protein